MILLAVVGETGLKLLAREEDAALHSAEGQSGFVGDFVVFVAGHMHREGYAVFLGELVDGGGDFLHGIRLFRRVDA